MIIKNFILFQVGVFFGGLAIAKDEQVIKSNCPNIIVGTPGRILALVRSKKLNLKNLKHFILDECDNDKWSAKPRNTPSPRPTKPRSSRRKTEKHELYDADRRSPMPPRHERTSRGPKSKGKSKAG